MFHHPYHELLNLLLLLVGQELGADSGGGQTSSRCGANLRRGFGV
jgi:hypothetical protein